MMMRQNADKHKIATPDPQSSVQLEEMRGIQCSEEEAQPSSKCPKTQTPGTFSMCTDGFMEYWSYSEMTNTCI